MEEMNKEIMENGAMEIVEEVTEKLTFKENLTAYGLAGVFGIGVVATGYLLIKGGKKAYNVIQSKRVNTVVSKDEVVVDVEEEDIHEVKDDESEQN